jgi:Ni/Co efflux regulator RcnB
MRTLSMIMALGLCAALATPAVADFRFSARIGTGGTRNVVQKGDVSGSRGHQAIAPKKRHRSEGHRRRGQDSTTLRSNFEPTTPGINRPTPRFDINKPIPRGPFKPHRSRPHRRGLPIIPLYRDDGYYEEDTVRPAPVDPLPPPPPEVETAEPPQPPDPRGPLRTKTARGVAPIPSEYTVGEPLPPTVPHVTLDWERYALPEPPPGHIYGRVGRDVLLIRADDRVVARIVPTG